MKFFQLSENSLLLEFEQAIAPKIAQEVAVWNDFLCHEFKEQLIEIVPSYCSIHMQFDVRKISFAQLFEKILASQDAVNLSKASRKSEKSVIEIPIYYGEEVGFDLAVLSQSSGLTVQEIIKIHSEKIYDTYAVGFAPGFAYLGLVDQRIAKPRKDTPRINIPAGSVGIAGQQTAVYPVDSPGGWQIIGRTPNKMIDFEKAKPALLTVGDKVRFVSISKQQYIDLGGVLA